LQKQTDDLLFEHMNVREKIGDIGKRVIGRGREVDFKEETERFAKTHGVPGYEAEKAVFLNIAAAVRSELAASGTLDVKSPNFKRFEAGLRQSFGGENPAKLFELNKVAAKFRTIPPPAVSPADVARMDAYFRTKNGGRIPSHAVVAESVRTAKNIDHLIARFSSDPRLVMHTGKMDSLLLGVAPELGADMAKILGERKRLEKAERHFGRELVHDKNMASFKKTAGESLTAMCWKAPAQFAIDVFNLDDKKSRLHGSGGKKFTQFAARFAIAGTRFAAREGWEGAKIVGSATRAAASYLNRELRR
jgi:hypothetical protein